MQINRKKLTLDCQATYEITVPGELNQSWLDWDGIASVTTNNDQYPFTVTVLIVNLDQAVLQGYYVSYIHLGYHLFL